MKNGDSNRQLTGLRIGFVATRLAGTDGVSLETSKWVTVLERLGHTCFFFAGQSEWPAERSRLVPAAYFRHPSIEAITSMAFSGDWGGEDFMEYTNPDIYSLYTRAFSNRIRPPRVTERIHEIKAELEKELYAFVREFDIELLIVENALSIPVNIPLGLALTEFIAETGFPTIAHHHDFFWERPRFLVNCVADYLNMAFPPNLPSITHVVINSIAAKELSLRTGVSAMVIPNVMDFAEPCPPPDDYAADVRSALRIAPDEKFFLQPTRVVQRKGIEHAIELTKRIGLKARLIISHASGDEGDAYERRVREFAELLDVPVNFEAELIRDQRAQTKDGRKVYTLADVYPHADLVTYPSAVEGFGNAFLEAIYFRRPIVINNYSIFAVDIKPKGFRVIEFDDYITDSTVYQTRQVLEDPNLVKSMTDWNYDLAGRYYSYAVLKRHLQTLIAEYFGEERANGY
jgi:glycosyltransferase involved in cell wall biosynthesis